MDRNADSRKGRAVPNRSEVALSIRAAEFGVSEFQTVLSEDWILFTVVSLNMRPPTRRQQALALGTVFVASFVAFSFYFLSQPMLADGDSYYHLGIARQFHEHGIIRDLPWARFSVMRDGFGDKELLFHLVLAALIAPGDAEEMGRLALAFFNSVFVVVLGWLGMRAVGWLGLLVPAFVYLGSLPFADRVIRLRPELMAVPLLLVIIWFAASRRRLPLAIVSALFALGYTAWHVVGLLAILFAVADRIAEARIDWKSPLATFGGIAAGLLLHPHFPHNLVIWWYQNVLFFLHKRELNVGTEIRPPALSDTLLYHLPFALALVIFWVCTRAASDDDEKDEEKERSARCFLIAAILFAILFTAMARMVTWLVPLIVLAVTFRRRTVVRPRTLRIGLAVTLAAALFQTVLIFRQGVGESHVLEAMAAALGRAIPAGANVAADWRDGTTLLFFAPQGRYLNVLDPTFMALSHPREYAISERIWSGDAVDVPASLRALDSDFIVFVPTRERRLLQARIVRDPRFTPLFTRGAILARLTPAAMPGFLRNWRVSPSDAMTPVAQWPFHSWSGEARMTEMEAYVDLSKPVLGDRCKTAAIELPTGSGTIEIAPWGPTEVRLDGSVVARTDRVIGAVLGNGLLIPLRPSAGKHWLMVTTCRSGSQRGFYALTRDTWER